MGTTARAPVVQRPAASKKPPRVALRPAQKPPAARAVPTPVSPVLVTPWLGLPTEPRSAPAPAAAPAVDLVQRRRLALAGAVLAFVALGGGVLVGVGGRALRESLA